MFWGHLGSLAGHIALKRECIGLAFGRDAVHVGLKRKLIGHLFFFVGKTHGTPVGRFRRIAGKFGEGQRVL